MKVVARMMNAGLSTTFEAWKRFVVMRREEKDLMRNTINRMKNSQLLIGWNGWMQFIDAQRMMERKLHMDKKEDLLPGVGSIMLAKVGLPCPSGMPWVNLTHYGVTLPAGGAPSGGQPERNPRPAGQDGVR